ncbi:MAG TPA: L,D-transpeptidase [Gaiellaceae bacterium]|nr:L,D-transpeptidase [Gaiellaceae bacterium]
MTRATRHIAILCCGLGLLAAFTPSAAARVDAPAAPDWLPPTPAEGTRFRVAVGEPLRIALVAAAREAADTSLSIGARGMPTGATLRTTTGNPAGATVRWIPQPAQSGRTFWVTFTARPDDPTAASATRRIEVDVTRTVARSFKLSSDGSSIYRYAFVMRRVTARRGPSAAAAPVARLKLLTPEKTTNLVLALDGRRTAGRAWVRVRLPVLPNNTTGWVPRSALSDWKLVRTRLVVNLRRMTMTLYRTGRAVFSTLVGIGRPRAPTPRGEFFVRNQLYGFHDPFYGPIAYGTSARSEVLTDWPAGGFVGIHGTNLPGMIPGRISHGCIRMRNDQILRLARLLPVGTPLTIR